MIKKLFFVSSDSIFDNSTPYPEPAQVHFKFLSLFFTLLEIVGCFGNWGRWERGIKLLFLASVCCLLGGPDGSLCPVRWCWQHRSGPSIEGGDRRKQEREVMGFFGGGGGAGGGGGFVEELLWVGVSLYCLFFRLKFESLWCYTLWQALLFKMHCWFVGTWARAHTQQAREAEKWEAADECSLNSLSPSVLTAAEITAALLPSFLNHNIWM